METLLRIPMSYEEYSELPERSRAEWVDGIVVMSPLGPLARHQRATRRLANLIEQALPESYVVDAVSIALPRNRERLPDVSVFDAEPKTAQPIAETPILVVEVLSPTTRTEDLMRKAPEYAGAGIEQYWVVDVDERWIEVQQNRQGRWEPLAVVDAGRPVVEVAVGGHGSVTVDLAAVLR